MAGDSTAAAGSAAAAAPAADVQVVVLAGGVCKRLYPLTSGGGGASKALLPVANRPLLSYPLRHLADAGVRSCIVVATGEATAAAVGAFLKEQALEAGGVAAELVAVPEECGTADALREVARRGLLSAARSVVVYSGDILTDLPLRALVTSHQVSGAVATVLVSPRRTSPTSETKPGKAPRGVDYLGLDAARQLLLFAASSPEALRDLKLPLAAVQRCGQVELRSDLTDAHLYVFGREALALLAARPGLPSLKLDFVPWLARRQLLRGGNGGGGGGAGGGGAAGGALLGRAASGSFGSFTSAASQPAAAGGGAAGAGGAAAGASAAGAGAAAADAAAAVAGAAAGAGSSGAHGDGARGGAPAPPLPGAGYLALSHGRGAGATAVPHAAGRVGVFLVPQGAGAGAPNKPSYYCARVNTVAAYGEVNRDAAAADAALHLTGLAPSKYDNVVPPSAALGAKATVGPACVVGEGAVVGDKTSVKRSVIGPNARLGAQVKVINSVLMDGVVVGDGAHLQGCVVCSGAVVQERASLRDCQVGPAFVVAANGDHRSEVLART